MDQSILAMNSPAPTPKNVDGVGAFGGGGGSSVGTSVGIQSVEEAPPKANKRKSPATTSKPAKKAKK